jgi:hypothetical protein
MFKLRIKRLLRDFRHMGISWTLVDRWRETVGSSAKLLETYADWLRRCYVCRETSDTRCCESCRRFVCIEHEDQDRTWEDCDMCQECGDVVGPDSAITEDEEVETK